MSKAEVLSPGDAIALGDLLTAIEQKRGVRWLAEGGTVPQDIKTGELRSLVVGQSNFALAPWGTDVRDMWVWVTGGYVETTFSVRHAIKCLHEGGMVFE